VFIYVLTRLSRDRYEENFFEIENPTCEHMSVAQSKQYSV